MAALDPSKRLKQIMRSLLMCATTSGLPSNTGTLTYVEKRSIKNNVVLSVIHNNSYLMSKVVLRVLELRLFVIMLLLFSLKYMYLTELIFHKLFQNN